MSRNPLSTYDEYITWTRNKHRSFKPLRFSGYLLSQHQLAQLNGVICPFRQTLKSIAKFSSTRENFIHGTYCIDISRIPFTEQHSTWRSFALKIPISTPHESHPGPHLHRGCHGLRAFHQRNSMNIFKRSLCLGFVLRIIIVLLRKMNYFHLLNTAYRIPDGVNLFQVGCQAA